MITFLPTPASDLVSKIPTDRIRPQSLLSLFIAPPGYIIRAHAPLRSILPRSKGHHRPEVATLEMQP
jgi:hypothetical protein